MASRRKMECIGDYYYDKKEILGHGAFAIVFKGYKKQYPSAPVAVKCIAKKELSKSKELLAKEISVLRKLSVCQHENVVALLDVKETDSSVFLMIEYCNGGDLADYLHSKGTLSEDTLSSFMQQIASALNAMNDKDIVHRDMKPQNILICFAKGGSKLTTPPTELQLKIADFGFARFLEEGKMAGTLCGSPMYMAPEVIMSHKYDSKADLWSVGTIIFQCLTGKAPFHANTPQQLRAFYEKNTDLKPKIPENTSPELKDMLYRLLTRDASRRISIKDLMQHPFLKRFKRKPHRDSLSSPIPARRRTVSQSSESSGTPGSGREASPLAREPVPDPDKDLASTLTASNDDDGFTKVEKVDICSLTPEDFVLVPEVLPEYTAPTGERKERVRAPLAEEECDAFEESIHSSRPVRLSTEEGRVTFRKDQHPSPTQAGPALRLPSPTNPSPSPPLAQRSGGGSSAPIPVPSLTRASSMTQREMVSKGASPARMKRRSASSGGCVDRDAEVNAIRRNSETALAPPDVTQVSPPAVQFSIGTPPSTGGVWKRTTSFGSCPTSTRTDPSQGSPLRRSASCSPGSCFTHGGGSVPLSSCCVPSSGHCQHHHSPHTHPMSYHHHPYHPQSCSPDPYAGCDMKFHRYPTVPDCTALVACSPGREELSLGMEACHRCGTEPDLRPFHMLRAYASHRQHEGLGALVQYAGTREAVMSQGVGRGSPPLHDQDRTIPIAQRRDSLMMDTSPPLGVAYSASPQNRGMPCLPQESPHGRGMPFMPLEPPELSEDTLMDDEHNHMVARISFLLDVVDIIVDLARSKNAVCNPMADSVSMKRADNLSPAQLARFSDTQRILEQLVLYLRAVQMMAQCGEMAERALKEEKMLYIKSVQNMLQQQNETYRFCIEECKRLYRELREVCSTKLEEPLVAQHADKLIYNYAVEQCQAGALDELAGNKMESYHRYTRAQVLLHSLCQWVQNHKDKLLLEKYCKSVEQRLNSLGNVNVSLQHYPCESCAS